jgi:hypothetical protein
MIFPQPEQHAALVLLEDPDRRREPHEHERQHARPQRREADAHLGALTAATTPRTMISPRRLRVVR